MSPDPPRIGLLLPRLAATLGRNMTSRVAPLTVPQYSVLATLSDHAGLSNAQLARRAFVTPQAMNQVMVSLESDRLVRREPHPTNRRSLQTTLTPKGRRLLASCDESARKLEDLMFQGFSDDEREAFATMLAQMTIVVGAALHET